jgi:hemoglobin
MTTNIRTGLLTLILATVVAGAAPAAALADGAGETSLYDRMGGWDNIARIVNDTIALHQANPEISAYFADVDTEVLAGHVTAFFAAGVGGPSKYTGRDMTTTHAGMDMTDADFDSAVADVLRACEMNGVGEADRAEVAAILESLRPAVMGVPQG